MIEIGGKPILWHIMKIYNSHGFNEFIILCGYKGYLIKEYFANYYRHMADLTIDMATNTIKYHNNKSEPWKVTLIDTGKTSMTGGRVKRAAEFIENKTFMLTYGDGVSDIDIKKLIRHHKQHGKHMTMTVVQPDGRFGAVNFNSEKKVISFQEKPKGDNAWINGGFFVCEPAVLDYIDDDDTVLEQAPLINLAQNNQLHVYPHRGFWKPMDTLRDKRELERLWNSGKAPWKIW